MLPYAREKYWLSVAALTPNADASTRASWAQSREPSSSSCTAATMRIWARVRMKRGSGAGEVATLEAKQQAENLVGGQSPVGCFDEGGDASHMPVELAVAAEHGGAARLSRDGLDGILVIEQREKRRSSDTRVRRTPRRPGSVPRGTGTRWGAPASS